MNRRISVVIPTYNCASLITETLQSVFAQSILPCEIVVVDDASIDGTAKAVAAIAKSSPVQIRLIELPQNSGGPARPLNIGVESAKGDLIATLDQDDGMPPSRLAAQEAAFG